tara:strand:- start:849 stop:1127 length:279 start_codon:yes stop_codon:yes gene_type:complete
MKNIVLISSLALLITACGQPMSLEQKIDAAHEQYQRAQVRHAGNRSSYLPRVGKIKADDYKNCVSQRYYRWKDSYDFCAWHAEIGSKWNYKG